MKRRTFIETSLATAAIAAAPRALWAGMPHHIQPIGLQLYTVRNLMKTDFDGTIAGVAKVGYKEVEFAGYDKKTPKEVRAVLDQNGLTAPSAHIPYDQIENKWPETLEAAAVVVGQTRKEATGEVYGLAFLENSPVLWNLDFSVGLETRDVQLECSSCHSLASYSLAGIELEVLDSSGELTHPCKKCNSSRVWRAANREAAAKKVSTAPTPALAAAPASTHDLTASPIEERRKNKRTAMKVAACVRFAGVEIVVDCEDISKGGFRFTDHKEYPDGTRVETAVPYSKFGDNIFSQGTVIYCHKLPDGRFRHGVAHAKKPESIGWDWTD